MSSCHRNGDERFSRPVPIQLQGYLSPPCFEGLWIFREPEIRRLSMEKEYGVIGLSRDLLIFSQIYDVFLKRCLRIQIYQKPLNQLKLDTEKYL